MRNSARGRSVEVVNLAEVATSSARVRRAAAHAVEVGELDALVMLCAHNEFLNRSGEHSRLRGWVWEGTLHSALIRLLDRFVAGTRPALPERLHAVDRGSSWFQARLQGYRRNLTELVRDARERDVPVFLMTAPINLSNWPPVHNDLVWNHADPDYDAHVSEAEALLAAGELGVAEEAIAGWRSAFGEDAMFVFQEGQIARLRGDPDAARALLRRPADLDPYPWRILSVQTAFLHELARGEGVFLVDVEAAFSRAAPNGLVGFEWIGDNVHPTPRGAALMALEVASALGSSKLSLNPPNVGAGDASAALPGRSLRSESWTPLAAGPGSLLQEDSLLFLSGRSLLSGIGPRSGSSRVDGPGQSRRTFTPGG